MMSFFRPRAILLALAFATAVSLPFFTSAAFLRDSFFFEVKVATNKDGMVQLFYDVGRGLREQDSGFMPLTAGTTPVLFRCELPPGYYRQLRFDPTNRDATVFFTDARIVDRSGKVVRRFGPGDFKAANQIARAVAKNGGLEMQTTPGGTDPNFQILIGEPFTLRVGIMRLVRAAAKPFLIAFFVLWGLTALPLGRLAASRIGRVIPWSEAHPAKAVALLSLLVVAVQCHPVIFFGKSFVSPNNAVLLLYDEFPVLPGYTSTVLENGQGSDVGALMYWHLYCPVIAHDALFRDHELPLWNRYTMDGLPLLGQGQSMFGDPLNWLSIVTRSAAWSWDVRFVIARWLLCCGLGLTVFMLTRHLPSALLVTVGAGFLGFFGYRLTHPANFSLCYSPWILYAWARLSQAGTLRAAARWSLLLMLASFSVLTSGTVKEACILFGCLNLAGLLLVLLAESTWRERLRRLGVAAGAGLVLGLLTAPLTSSFLSTLQRSWTNYDKPNVSQAQPAEMITFFDDLFSRQLRENEWIVLPAANFIFLLGFLWALVSLRELLTRRAFVALGLAALVPFAAAFGIVPARFIMDLPFFANIVHIDNTMFCALIILSAVLAGFGFEALFRQLGRPAWKLDFTVFLLVLGVLAGVYLAVTQNATRSGFFIGYAWSLIIAVVVLPLGLHLARRKADASLAAMVLCSGVFLMTWRHSQYLKTPFDDYVFNPQVRVNLHPVSPAVKFVDAKMTEPSRPIGFGLNLFPGYNQMLGWESILGVDPLRNRYHDELARAFGFARVKNADDPLIDDEAHAPNFVAGLDLLNVRYYVASHSAQPRDIPGLTRLGQFDLDVYESEKAWPRAFFTDRVWSYDNVTALAEKTKSGDRRPFAAVEKGEEQLPQGVESLDTDLTNRTVQPATHYHLTTNTTSFDVQAPSAGVIVLSENYYPDEFRVTVNGQPAEYFRVNHAFKGIYVGAPGTYRVEYDYWPHAMTLSLVLAAIGVVGVAALGWLAWRPEPMPAA